jgi:hypothetical protein
MQWCDLAKLGITYIGRCAVYLMHFNKPRFWSFEYIFIGGDTYLSVVLNDKRKDEWISLISKLCQFKRQIETRPDGKLAIETGHVNLLFD